MRKAIIIATALVALVAVSSSASGKSDDSFGDDSASRMETSGAPVVMERIAPMRTEAVDEVTHAQFGNDAASKVETSGKPGVVANAALSAAEGVTVYCWASDWWVQWHRRSLAGVSVWKYRLTVTDFCWNGRKILDVNSHRSVKIGVPLWDFCCHLSETKNWNARWSFRRWTEGKFVWLGPVGVAVRTPEVWFKLRGDGWFDYGAKGD
jgi:hypothetical protein